MSKLHSSLLALISAVLVTSGCANGYGGYGAPKQIIIDTQGVDMSDYHQDLADCESYARQIDVRAETTESVVEGAVVGGVIGA